MRQYIFLLVTSLFMGACGSSKQEDQVVEKQETETMVTLTVAQAENAGIRTGKLNKQPISSILKANGVIEVPPQNTVSISAPMGGYLKSTRLLPGMFVKKGESIALLEDPQYIQLQEDYLTAKAKLEYARLEYERQKELNQSKAVSDKVYQQSLREFTSLQVLVRSLSEKLKLIGLNPARISVGSITRNIRLYSPINGYVTKMNANIGKYVSPSDVLFEIVDLSDIHLAITVFEKSVNKLKVGQKLVAYTNSNPDKKYNCEIILIGKDFTADRSVELHCHFDKVDKDLIPGTFMNAEIELKSSEEWVIPSDAIVNFENRQYVFIDRANHNYEMIEIQTGITENNLTQLIMDDSLSNQSFVLSGAYNLLMKLKNTGDD